MENNLLAPMIAAIVSIVALCVTNIISIIENKKSRYITVVTNQTIEHKERVFKNASEILALTHPLLIIEPCENDLLKLKKKLLLACTEFELRIRPVYNETFEQISAMRRLVKLFLKYKKQPTNNNIDFDKLYEAHSEFLMLMSCFDSANWHYIKMQSDGKKRVPGTFAKSYFEQKQSFDDFGKKPRKWTEEE